MATMDWTTCPELECRQPAEVQWRCVLPSTDGPIEHVKVVCLDRHWFLLSVEMLAASRAPEPAGEVTPARE
ncbi:MAG: hypothetical protein ACRDRZ_03325 [Pseudonocardiaceae bacterium]